MTKVPHSNSIKGLGALSGLVGLVVKATPVVAEADLAAQVKAIAQSKADAQKAKDVVRVLRDAKGRAGRRLLSSRGFRCQTRT